MMNEARCVEGIVLRYPDKCLHHFWLKSSCSGTRLRPPVEAVSSCSTERYLWKPCQCCVSTFCFSFLCQEDRFLGRHSLLLQTVWEYLEPQVPAIAREPVNLIDASEEVSPDLGGRAQGREQSVRRQLRTRGSPERLFFALRSV